MVLLSRVAESLFWMGRYVERAESTARLLDVTYHARIEPNASPGEIGATNTWQALLTSLGLEDAFAAKEGEEGDEQIIRFLTLDAANASSILSSITQARENARGARDYLSSEVWLAINRLYRLVSGRHMPVILRGGLYEFCDEVRDGCQRLHGVVDATCLRDEGWHWLKSGLYLERADMVTRFVDSKYWLVLRSLEDVGGPVDRFQWGALLRSLSGYEAFRRTHAAGMEPPRILEFLLLNPEFPRSLRAGVDELLEALSRATQGAEPRLRNRPLRLVSALRNRLEFETIDSLMAAGIHEFLDEAQSILGDVSQSVNQSFFWSDAGAA